MRDVSSAIRYRPAAKENPELVNLTEEFKNRDNADFLAEMAKRLAAKATTLPADGIGFDRGGIACIGLMGEYGLIGYGIRRAQEIIRVDRTPSYWSHAFLIYTALSESADVNRDPTRSAWIWESTLEPSGPFNHFTVRNGVGPRRISDYTRGDFDLFAPHCVPNFAILTIGLTPEERQAIIDRADDPDVDQLRYDLSGLLGTWFAYLTDRAGAPNPLGAGNAIYCSAYVQLAYDAAGIDLAPGAHQRNTSPEHMWQAAKYLYETFRAPDTNTGERRTRPVVGWYVVRDPACLLAPVDAKIPRTIRDLLGGASSRSPL